MEQQNLSQLVSDGNTETSETKKRDIRSRGWFFTLNNYEATHLSQLPQCFGEHAKYVFQEEKGESGTPHLQGFVMFKNQMRLSTLKNIDRRIHWEVAKDWIRAKAYCTKLETRVGDVFTNMDDLDIVKVPDIFRPLPMWQDWLLNFVDDPNIDNREIVWIYDKFGGIGKTFMCRYLCLKSKRNAYCTSGRSADINYLIAGLKPKVVLINLVRSMEGHINYGAIEGIKDGIIFSTKYESKVCIFNIPKVVVFANCLPNYEAMSLDRWRILEVEKSGIMNEVIIADDEWIV